MTNQQREELTNKFRDKLLYVNYSANTIETYLRYVNVFLTWCPVELENLTPIEITAFMGTLEKYSAPSKNNILKSYLPAFFNFLVNVGVLKVNPLTLLKIPTAKGVQKDIEILSADELKKIMCNPAGRPAQLFRNKILLTLLATTGMRISEALSLRTIDIKENKLVIHGKGAKERTIDITTHTAKLLQEYLRSINVSNDEPIFALTRQRALHIVVDTAKKNEITKKISPHSFRHSFATLWAKNGGSEGAMRKHFGWQKNFNCSVYVDLANQDISKQYNKIAGELE